MERNPLARIDNNDIPEFSTEQVAGDPNNPATWAVIDMDTYKQRKMGDPNNPATWEVADVDALLEPVPIQEIVSDPIIEHPLLEHTDDHSAETEEPQNTSQNEEAIESVPSNLPTAERQVISLKDVDIYSRYKNEFNIDASTLSSIEGFDKLSSDQKEFVLQNLQQTALRQIESEGIVNQRQALAEAPFVKKMWLGLTKGYQLNKQKKAITESIFSGEVDQTETLTTLVSMVSEGPHVTKLEDGSFQVDVASATDFDGDLSEREHEAIDHFNEKANEFNNLPYEFKTGTPEQQEAYDQLENEYKVARDTILILKESHGASKEDRLLYGNEIDRKVMMGQFMTANPEVETALMNIKNDSVMKQTLQEILNPKGALSSKGGIMAMGFAARTTTTSLLGAAAIPLVGAGIGLWRGRVDAKEKITQNELLARSGEDWRQDKSYFDKKYEEKTGKEVANEVRHNIISTEHLVGKIEKIIERIEGAESDNEREKLLGKLQARISYTEDKIRSNMVNFGKAHAQTGNQLDLLQALGTAKAYGEMPTDEVLADRVDRYLGYIDNTVDANQKKFVNRRMYQGAALGAGFAFAGAAAAEGYSELTTDTMPGTASVYGDFSNDVVEVGGAPETTTAYDPNKDIEDVSGPINTDAPYPGFHNVEGGESALTKSIDPLGPSDGEPTVKTFVSDAELNNGYVASPETTEKMEDFMSDGDRIPPESIQERMGAFEQRHDGGEGEPSTADAIMQHEINKHDSMLFGKMATPTSETPPNSFELDDHARGLLQKETSELSSAAEQQVAPTPLDTYTTGRLEQEANIQSLVKEINKTPGYEVRPGDNVWNIIKNKLEAHDLFRGLEEGQRNHLIDELKNKVANMSADDIREFGIKSGDPNIIKAGENLNFSKILGVDTLEKAVFNAENLSAAQIDNIEDYVPPQRDPGVAAEVLASKTETAAVRSGFEADGDTIFVNEGEQRDQLLEQMKGMNPEYDNMLDAQTTVFRAENMINEDLTKMYGSKGIFGSGLGGTEGVRSAHWLDLKDRVVTDLLAKEKFPMTDQWGTELSDIGYDSEQAVHKMQVYLDNLSKESGLKPEYKETVSKFIRRASEKMLTPSE